MVKTTVCSQQAAEDRAQHVRQRKGLKRLPAKQTVRLSPIQAAMK